MNNKEGDPSVWKSTNEDDDFTWDIHEKVIEQKIDELLGQVIPQAINRLAQESVENLYFTSVLKKEEMEEEINELITVLVHEIKDCFVTRHLFNKMKKSMTEELEQKIMEIIINLIHQALGQLSQTMLRDI